MRPTALAQLTPVPRLAVGQWVAARAFTSTCASATPEMAKTGIQGWAVALPSITTKAPASRRAAASTRRGLGPCIIRPITMAPVVLPVDSVAAVSEASASEKPVAVISSGSQLDSR